VNRGGRGKKWVNLKGRKGKKQSKPISTGSVNGGLNNSKREGGEGKKGMGGSSLKRGLTLTGPGLATVVLITWNQGVKNDGSGAV